MTDLDQLMEAALPMDVSAGPHGISLALGEIEDELAQRQNDHAVLAGKVKRREKFIETYTAQLYERVDPKSCANPTERMTYAKSDLHDDDTYKTYLEDVEKLEIQRKTLQYLEIRRSIGQTILRRGNEPGDPPAHGSEAWGQAGQ